MFTCRSISPETWDHARQALIFYFSRRSLANNAEDLAQDTLAAIWARPDFEFEKEEDFLKVCYGFAANVQRSGYRKEQKHAGRPLDEFALPPGRVSGMHSIEIGVLLDEVLRIAKSGLRTKEWELIEVGADANRGHAPDLFPNATSNSVRVNLHRARKKLQRLTGWSKS